LQREQVKTLAGYGLTHDEICAVMHLTGKTLRAHYREELDLGPIEANGEVARALYTNAVKKGNIVAQLFWLKCRAGWREAREPPTIEGTPPTIIIKGGLPIEPWSQEQVTVIHPEPGLVRLNGNGKGKLNGHGNGHDHEGD
jgi:hypothetical protein